MANFGLCGPTYTSRSRNADAERCMNFYPELVEGSGKTTIALYGTPGLSLFCTLPEKPVRQIYVTQGRTFGIGGSRFCEIKQNKTFTPYAPIANDSKIASMTAGPTQVLFASAGLIYVFDLTVNTLTQITEDTTSAPLPMFSVVGYCDGFFLALQSNSNKWWVSNPLDATQWNPGNTSLISVFPDNPLSMIVNQRQIWFFSQKKSVVYYNSGGALFPFDVVPGSLIENGSAAIFAPVLLDNTVMWLGQDERGAGIVWRANQYIPQRISNHGIEFFIQNYPTITDAVGYSYQDQGHSFYVLYFPTANTTLVYDVATQLWHERGFFTQAGQYVAHSSQCHAYNWGMHLVGDWQTGNIYQMSINNFTDYGNPIRRFRRTPAVTIERERLFFNRLEINLESGLGSQPPLYDSQGNPRDPQLMLRWSNDDAHTWRNWHTLNCGQAGEFTKRVFKSRLGESRQRVFEFAVTDPIDWKIIDGYVTAEPSYAPSERIAASYRKVT